jgi:hypothetical protein
MIECVMSIVDIERDGVLRAAPTAAWLSVMLTVAYPRCVSRGPAS